MDAAALGYYGRVIPWKLHAFLVNDYDRSVRDIKKYRAILEIRGALRQVPSCVYFATMMPTQVEIVGIWSASKVVGREENDVGMQR